MKPDSVASTLRFPISTTVPTGYEDLMASPPTLDLASPSNIVTTAEWDQATGCYIIRTRLGEWEIADPIMLTAEQYNQWQMRQAMIRFNHRRNSEAAQGVKTVDPFNPLDLKFGLGPLEKIFGPGGLRLRTQGSVRLRMGIKTTRTDNPALAVNARRRTYFDFDQKIQATIGASVGDRLKFNMTYNTDATFDFDSKNLKLAYEGTEDDIVKSIEAGNVSMTTGSSLIRGSTALFGLKTKLQFGRLTATALVSQQNSESRSVSSKGGVQTTAFTINADEYDQNRHFFLAHFFRDNYDRFAAHLPLVSSGIKINRIEVWITNKNSSFGNSRDLVAFMDIGENSNLGTTHWLPDTSVPVPSNSSNDLLSTLKSQYPDARNINAVTQVLQPLSAFGIEGGRDFEKVESARLLSESEYTLNSTLGYISLKSALSSDEVLAVAFEYTWNGRVYQVGEFSSDITATDDALYVKMLKATTVSTSLPMWDLMMKNVYSLGAYQLQKQNFKLNIKYLSDTTGTFINYLPIPGLSGRPIISLMNLDRLDSSQQGNPDGLFDYIEGYTVESSTGKIIFPVVEPFGAHLASVIDNPSLAGQYTYPELYDSTLVVARQFAEKNKFVLTGEYQASSGSQIRLNAYNVPRGSVVVTAGGTVLTENTDYTVDYSMGIVTITNQSIIDSGQSVNVTLENQSMFSTQRKTLLGLDLQYELNRHLTFGGTILHYAEKALTEKVNIGDETVSNTMFGVNLNYNSELPWLTDLLNRIPTVNATAPSRINVNAEAARLMPHSQRSGSNRGSSYVDDFENTQSGIDLRSPYSWFLASTPYDPSASALFPEAGLSDNIDYGKNRALLAWYYIDRMFTSRNSSLCPGYIRADLKQLSNPYVREVTSREIFPGRELTYGESQYIQTLNLSFYPTERGPYNLDATDIDADFNLLYPERRWGGIMRRMDNTNFEQSNIEYIQFWLMSPFLDPENPNTEGGDLYINLGEISEDILKDGKKSYENGIPLDPAQDGFLQSTVWGRVSSQNSLTYSFDNNTSSRPVQDVGLDGLRNPDEFTFPTYSSYLDRLRERLSPATVERLENAITSPFVDPAGDNYHFFRGVDYDEARASVLERYKHYNGVEGNSLSPGDVDDPLYQSARNVPDVEDINQDNTLNEYERYYQYRISIRPEDFVVGKNYITDKQVSLVHTRDGENTEVEWYQFKIPLADFEKAVGGISDFTTIRFARIFMTGFRHVTHLRFATLELVRGEWRPYEFSLDRRGESAPEGSLDISVVNIEENASREPVNYVLPPGVTRADDPGQSQVTQLNEQSMSLSVTGLDAGNARAVYRNTQLDLRNYRRLQMWVHAEAPIDNLTATRSGDMSLFIRLGSDVRSNFYEYEISLSLTPPAHYYDTPADREIVWPELNRLNLELQRLVNLKTERNRLRSEGEPGIGFNKLYTSRDPDNERNTMSVMGNPTLSDIRVMVIGIRNNSATTKDATVWVNELKVTDFNESGGWAAKASVNLAMSDIATLNVGGHIETAGFGNVDQSLNERRLDDFSKIDVAMQVDIGRFLPSKAKLRAPVYYAHTREKITPKYNPLDPDVKLKDALTATSTRAERDSIRAYAEEHRNVTNFSISGLKFDVSHARPMPWDPANFTFNFSLNKQQRVNPTTDHEYTNDYRGSLQYAYSPIVKGWQPFRHLKSRNKNLSMLKDWTINYMPASVTFLTSMSRYYYEMQTRSEVDQMIDLPLSVSKNFLWDRQFGISWNLTKTLSLNLNTTTSARIEETVGAVNRKLFPDRYREWKDTVWQSILSLGTPWAYNQTFVASYKAPFSKIPVLDFITANASYNATYRWDRGAEIDGISTGNSIANQGVATADGRLNLESLYSKIPYLKDIDKRFSSTSRRSSSRARKPRQFTRNLTFTPDSVLNVAHNLRSRRVRVTATALDNNQKVKVVSTVVDNNNIRLSLPSATTSTTLKVTVTEYRQGETSSKWAEAGAYATRLAMSLRNVSFRYRRSQSLSLPLFNNNVGDVFGQSLSYGAMSPGLDFAFGLSGEDYVYKAKRRGWLITDDGQTSPALFSRANEVNLELTLEPIRGLKILLTTNRTDNRSRQIQFMYDDMPVTRGGSFTMTHCAIATALGSSSASSGYASKAFSNLIDYIPQVASRVESQYSSLTYPSGGFMSDSPLAGQPFNAANGGVSATGSDVLIPAFLAAYTGSSPSSVQLSPFPSFAHALPNWRVTYDGILRIGNLSKIFKTFTLSHAYQCTYTVGSFSSFANWLPVDGDLGFTLDELSGSPIPSSPYNISSVAINEKFAPLIGVNVTFKNDISVNAEYRDSRTVTLNTSAGQVVEATTKGLTIGAGYKIVNFNSILKIGSQQKGFSNDLTLNADISLQNTQALIRRLETAYTQATSGTRTFTLNFSANYNLSKRLTIGAYLDHQVNTPLVTNSAFPTTNTSYGLLFNISLAR
ncbi:MAG: cell surface protein SprA [Muribaculaceae bacterium]|nr:cell surface protein SprA [Muribaculaceae bacterium]